MVSDETIQQAAKVIDGILSADPQVAREMFGDEPDRIARALAEAGLLAPTPLTHEEWDVLIDDRYYANLVDKNRESAEGMVRRGHGKLVHRYVTDWEEA